MLDLSQFPPETRASLLRQIAKTTCEFEAKVADYKATYPHVISETLKYNPDLKRYEADCKCTQCGAIHNRTAQDFHQCQLCEACKVKQRRAKRSAARATYNQILSGM